MDRLPTDVIQTIALNLDYASLLSLRLVSSRFNRDPYRNEYFWKRKFLQDFGDYIHPVESWRIVYRDTGNILKTDSNDNTKCLKKIKAKDLIYKYRYIDDPYSRKDLKISEYTILQPDGSIFRAESHIDVCHIHATKIKNAKMIAAPISFASRIFYLTNVNRLYDLSLIDPILDVDVIFMSIGARSIYAIDTDNNIWVNGHIAMDYIKAEAGRDSQNFTKIPNLKAKYVSSADTRVAIIDMNDNVWIWGDYGALGIPGERVSPPRIIPGIKAKQVTCTYYQTFLIDIDGNLWVAGTDSSQKVDINQGFIKIPNILAKSVIVSDGIGRLDPYQSMIVDLQDNIYTYEDDQLKKLPYKAYKPIDKRLFITLGYTPHVKINDKTVFIISYDRLQEKLKDKEITDYNILPQLQYLKKNGNNTMVLFRDIYDKLSVCEVVYDSRSGMPFLTPFRNI